MAKKKVDPQDEYMKARMLFERSSTEALKPLADYFTRSTGHGVAISISFEIFNPLRVPRPK